MIVLVQSAPAFGAIERYLAAVVAGLEGRGEDVVLLHPDAVAMQPFRALAGDDVRLESFVPAAAPLLALNLARRLRRLRPRLVHVNDPMPAAVLAARIARVPRVLVTHHTPELCVFDSPIGALWRRLGWALRPEVIYTSESDRQSDGRARSMTHVVYYGIDLDRFVAARPSLVEDGPVIGNVARLVPQKGQRTIVEAAPLILERHPRARFVLVGDGESRAELKQAVAADGLSDRFRFLGERDDVPGLLASFDVFVLPSRFEGLCYAVIEAQAAGVPVVATPVGGVRENVRDGETGIVVPPDEPAALAAAVNRLLDDPAEARRLADAARDRALSRYAVARMVSETIALYEAPTRGRSDAPTGRRP